ncbi:hypothetical protein ACFQRB_01035 [Halobaculum litoreum]|uniref:5'-nucleotidase, C-terminal domain n=1 Tax=Halobaculum litoreum TaxID=3031998 RepID=A0ABD5XR86_9EURY
MAVPGRRVEPDRSGRRRDRQPRVRLRADAITDAESGGGVTNDSRFPWLATNLVDADTGEAFAGTESARVVDRGGVRVGLIGLVDDGATFGKTNIDFEGEGLRVEDYTETGPAEAKRLREEEDVDVVVALAHTGVPDAEALAEADTDDAIDVVVAGDDEIVYPPEATSGTVVTEGRPARTTSANSASPSTPTPAPSPASTATCSR